MVKIMTSEYTNTEDKILEAAKQEFIKSGFKGTSMQQIADAARINKSLLHYYFRSKEKLFSAVFSFAMQKFIPHALEIITSSDSIFIKIEKIVYKYIDVLLKNPFIPVFILHELNRNPQRIHDLLLQSGINPDLVFKNLITEKDKHMIRDVDPVHLFTNTLALCVFPVGASPLLRKILFNDDKVLFQQFMQERKAEVTSFIIHAIKK